MNLQAITITNGIGVMLLIILFISSHLVRRRQNVSDRLFMIMTLLTTLSCIVETITFLVDGVNFPFARAIDMILNSYLYITNLSVSFIWCIYVDERFYGSAERIKKIYKWVGIPTILGYIGILINFKYNILFTIDENLIYHREPLGNLYYFVTFFNFGVSIFVRNHYRKNYEENKFFPIYMFLVPICIGATLQLLIYGISLAWCSVTLGLVGIHMSLQNEVVYIDPLTKLYNRNYLNHTINLMGIKNIKAGGIMIDLDYFKSINDTYGHSVGDEALVDAANVIRKAVPKNAICIRYAGDEFIVLLKTKNISDIIDMKENIRKELQKFNDSNKREYKLSFSIGQSIYDSKETTTDNFMHAMDENMYEEKRRKHSRNVA